MAGRRSTSSGRTAGHHLDGPADAGNEWCDAMIAIAGEFPEARIIRTDHIYRGRAGPAGAQAGARAYLLKICCTRNCGTIRAVHAGKKRFRLGVLSLAEHATDDALTPAEVRVLRLMLKECQQRDCSAASVSEKPSRASQEHPLQIGAPTTDPPRDDSLKPDHRILVTRKSDSHRPFGASGSQRNLITSAFLCDDYSQSSPAVRLA